MERKIYYKNEFYEAVEKKTKVKLNYTQQLILSLFDKEGKLEYSPELIKQYHFIESTFRNNLKTLIKHNIIIKVNNNHYELHNDVKKKLYLTKGFYVNTELFNNPKLTQASVILYSFFDKFNTKGFVLRKSGIRQYISITDKTLYENIKLLLDEKLLIKEKTKYNNQYKYTTIPTVDKETIEETPTIDEQPTTSSTIDNEIIERLFVEIKHLNERLNKAGEVINQQQKQIDELKSTPQPTINNSNYDEKLKADIELLNKKINSLYDRQMNFVNLFQPVVNRIDEIDSDLNCLYHLTDNQRAKQETELNMNMLRGLI